MGNALRKQNLIIENNEETARNRRLGEILKKLMKECDIEGPQLARNVGITPTTIYRILNDHNSNPTLASLEALAKFFSVKVSQLIGDEPLEDRQIGAFVPDIKSWYEVPLLEGEQAIHWNGDKNLLPLNYEVTTTSLNLSTKAFATRMKGDSMEPVFPDGTILIIEPLQKPQSKDHVLVLIDKCSSPIFRKIFIDEEKVYLKSLNTDMENVKTYQLNRGYKILGVMVQARTDFMK